MFKILIMLFNGHIKNTDFGSPLITTKLSKYHRYFLVIHSAQFLLFILHKIKINHFFVHLKTLLNFKKSPKKVYFSPKHNNSKKDTFLSIVQSPPIT